jgi:hypothetical protein
MSYLTSHIYMMFLLMLVGITPIYPVVRATILPYWYEWILLVWLSGLLLFELTNPSDKSGLGWIKVTFISFKINCKSNEYTFIGHRIGFWDFWRRVPLTGAVYRASLLADAHVPPQPVVCDFVSVGGGADPRLPQLPSPFRPVGHHYW